MDEATRLLIAQAHVAGRMAPRRPPLALLALSAACGFVAGVAAVLAWLLAG